MSGTAEGAAKTVKTNMERYGKDFYQRIGSKGGSKKHPETRPFYKNRKLSAEAGRKGGLVTKKKEGK